MKINYNVTGAERKSLVGAISQELNTPAKYLGMPTAAYKVGEYTIDKTGAVTGPDNPELVADLCALHSFKAVSEEYDDQPDIDQHHPGQYTDPNVPPTEAMLKQAEVWMEGQPEFEDLRLTEREELGLGRERRDPVGEDGMQASDVPESYTYKAELSDTDCPDRLTIEIPLDSFTPEKLDNLSKLVNAKAPLLKAALGTDDLPIKQTADTLQFPWFRSETTIDSEHAEAYATLISLLCKTVIEKKRVTAKEKDAPDNPKYAMRCFLLSLGMIGDEYKAARKILLSRLEGNSSWKNGRKAESERPVEDNE